MNKAPSVYAALAALLAAVDARNLHQPRATAVSDYDFGGFSPKPTDAPNFPFHQALQHRAVSSSSPTVVYVAPDATCGFISGLAGAGYTCGVGATCVFFTSSTAPGHVACCNSVDCNARNVCIDYKGYFSESRCDNGCAVDTFTLKCTNTALPYCNTISFPGDIMDVFCNNVDITEVQAALTTYRGQSSRRFTPLTLTGDSPASTSADDTTSTTPSSSPTSSATGGGGGGGGNNGNNGNGGDSDGSSDGDNDNGNKNGGGSKSNTGAIVGGVVGGVGGLALIGLAAFFFLRRKKSATGHEPVSQNPPIYQSPPMQQNPQGFYDPKFAAATGQQPYPPPNQQYVQPQGFYAPQPSVSPDGQTMSPAGSHVDPRYSVAPSSTSPAPSGGYVAPVAGGFQPQENVIHEAPAQPSENHRGEMHELA
ncbi:hypothetical protein TARUN_6582 [Trichoderma arundinaceum]|uniref:Uncharacterized protein n=1 Tax=Trichoderma arundinaceum TaxID=490622 RepID=A0A395NI80_TRIAR|nr:hypothetical protein TARUN_6582 [Trichoderma arundinaceum]